MISLEHGIVPLNLTIWRGCVIVLLVGKRPTDWIGRMSNYGITLDEAKGCLDRLEQFSTGTLSANWELFGDSNRYIVRSYGVEIADYSERSLHPKAKTYSKTTSRHANLVASVWGLN